MIKESDCRHEGVLDSQHDNICPRCGQSWTETESRSITVSVTAPKAMKGDTK